ncbi:haloacid dehalogenase [Croceivirga lutea]|uniref:HAD family hydrolase n=1 Tax=Croceivirga lutea TaxID=1775167 RepID=UPI0016399221|nr:HAD family hydrolase [Croceivirga lutea]GGG57938.1 haloacid dehalogenase [Croceivirga lutea]
MDLSRVKMVVSDMDGTLLNSNHEVSNQFFELFTSLQNQGIHFVAASGRQYHSMLDKLSSIKNQITFIAENGALIKRNDEVLLTTPIARNAISGILDAVHPVSNAHPVLCSENNAYVDGASDDFLKLLKEYYSSFEIVTNQKEVDTEVLKVAIYHFEDSEKYIYPKVEHFEGDLKVKVSGSNWVDVSHKNANKGYALEKVMKEYNVSTDELLVFGDYNNDIEMLALAKYSFAMENAHPNVKRVAQFQTTNNNDYGVERILEKLIK